MAAPLTDGSNCGLKLKSSESDSESKITKYLVKSTDAIGRALGSYFRNQKKITAEITIQTLGNGNLIRIPGLDDSWAEFHCNSSDIKPSEDPSSLEIAEKCSSNPMMTTTGIITKKICILATDDVYRTTKQKMNLAEEQSRKQCTKEIDRFDPDKGRRVKKAIRPSSLAMKGQPPPSATKAAAAPVSLASSSLANHSTSSPTFESSAFRHVAPAPSRLAAPSPAAASASLGRPSASPASAGRPSASPASSVRPFAPSSTVATSSSSKPSPASGGRSPDKAKPPLSNRTAQSNYTYRDRAVHLLALRPFKKVELVQRLIREGLPEKDRKYFTQVMKDISMFDLKKNVYILQEKIRPEIRLDWPLYSEEERKQIQSMYFDGGSDAAGNGRHSALSSPSLSPCLSSISSSQGSPVAPTAPPPPKPGEKRPFNLVDDTSTYHEPTARKQRIAHSQMPTAPAALLPQKRPANSADTSTIPAPPTKKQRIANGPTSAAASVVVETVAIDTGIATTTAASSSRSNTSVSKTATSTTTTTSIRPAKSKPTRPADGMPPPVESRENLSSLDSSADYKKLFQQVATPEQRDLFKSHFVAEYDEYKRLYGKMAERMAVFQNLKERASNSDTYEVVKLQIMEEYRRLQADKQYLADRRRCEYLHAKLGHIKALVTEYDQRRANLLKSTLPPPSH